MKYLIISLFLCVLNSLSYSQDIDTNNINVIDSTFLTDSIVNTSITRTTNRNKNPKKDSIRNYQVVDSARLINRAKFHQYKSSVEAENIEPQPYQTKTNFNYYYFLFLLFIIGIILFSRFFPYQFKLQYMAFIHRASQSELLSTENDWLEAEKIFPFVISLLFYSTWIVTPLLNLYSLNTYSYSVLIIGCIVFALLFLVIRVIQILLSYPLEFKEIMEKFTRTSFNSSFVISLVGFPIIIILLTIFKVNIFENPTNSLLIIGIIYSIRTIKSVLNCLRYEQRQIIYLIIYLCTLEIPLLLIGIKWIRDNTQL